MNKIVHVNFADGEIGHYPDRDKAGEAIIGRCLASAVEEVWEETRDDDTPEEDDGDILPLTVAVALVADPQLEKRQAGQGLVRHPTVHVTTITVTDPETRNPVVVEIRKDLLTGAMVGIDGSYLEQDVGEVRDPYLPPFPGDGVLDIPDDETN
jgi:hypothetical protein